jgi:hypothetical protein
VRPFSRRVEWSRAAAPLLFIARAVASRRSVRPEMECRHADFPSVLGFAVVVPDVIASVVAGGAWRRWRRLGGPDPRPGRRALA